MSGRINTNSLTIIVPPKKGNESGDLTFFFFYSISFKIKERKECCYHLVAGQQYYLRQYLYCM